MSQDFKDIATDYTWQPYRARPLAIWAMRMNRDFECPTLEGTLRGKAGDWILRADDGMTFPVPHEIFSRYYVKREWRRPDENKSKEHEVAKKHEGHEEAASVNAPDHQDDAR
jgi:hypothetical protein